MHPLILLPSLSQANLCCLAHFDESQRQRTTNIVRDLCMMHFALTTNVQVHRSLQQGWLEATRSLLADSKLVIDCWLTHAALASVLHQ